jgi:uncharacterized surface protein with fasciclin (FAS1) repeats
MKKLILVSFMALIGSMAYSQSKDVVDMASASADHTTLVAAVKAADLVEALKGAGPFTIFAPTNAAFGKLPAGTVPGLLKPENKAQLAKILTYHVVSGNLDSKAVMAAIEAGGGKAALKTLGGGMLTLTVADGKVVLTDEGGNTATVTTADVMGSNGVLHVIDHVVLPN